MTRYSTRFRRTAVLGAVVSLVALAGCAESERTPSEDGTGDGGTGASGGNFVFAGSADPVTLNQRVRGSSP